MAFQVVSPRVDDDCFWILFEGGNNIRFHVFFFAPLKCLTTTLFFSSDNFQPFTYFTIESPNIIVTGSLFFLGILLAFLQEVMRWLLLLSSVCIDLSHAPSSELSFPIESVGFSSGDKTEKRFVVSFEVLCWSFDVDVLAGFSGYS